MAGVSELLLESPLCGQCSVLRFEDRRFGGAEKEDLASNPVLTFGNEDTQKEFKLDYTFSDSLPGLPDLKASAEGGCAFCKALRDAILTLQWNDPGRVILELRYIWRENPWDTGLRLLLVDLKAEPAVIGASKFEDTLIFYIDAEPGGACMSWLQTIPSPQSQPLCPKNIEWIEQELARCDAHHCAVPESLFLPTRLLDLGTNDTSEDFKLISTLKSDLDSRTKYTALSYCWGSENEATSQLRTTTSNLAEHYQKIAMTSTTRLVQDAVKLARAISIRYLWIDALCIVQDDNDDWNRESAQMGLIYTNAYIAFCTPTVSSCLEGFLERPAAVNIGFRSQLRPSIHGTYSIRYQDTQHKFELEIDSDITPEYLALAYGGEWSKRAWTLQEHHLSTRRLYFGFTHIHFHCSKGKSTEPGWKDASKTHNTFRDQVLDYRQSRNRELLFEKWDEIIHDYVRREATHKTDMFPAISGLAKMMATEINDKYVAGLWSNDLPRGLLWKDWKDPCSPKSSTEYIGPSWSWTSVPTGYEAPWFTTSFSRCHSFIETNFRSECTILTTWCTPRSDLNPYGQITHAEAHIEGKLRSCPSLWRKTNPTGWFHFLERWTAVDSDTAAACAIDFVISDQVSEVKLENASMLLLASTCGTNSRWPSEYGSADFGHPIQGFTSPSETSQVGVNSHEDLHDSEKRNAWGLLLRPVPDTEKFVRIGIFRVASERGGLRPFKEQPFCFVKIV